MGEPLVTTDPGNGLEKVLLKTAKGASAEVYLHGAHLTSFKTASGKEVLFVSKEAVFKPPKAIRGGVPVCFPQFGALGPLGQHGFARNTAFEVVGGDDSSVTLALEATGKEDERYAHPFELRVTVTLSDESLAQELAAKNMGGGVVRSRDAPLHRAPAQPGLAARQRVKLTVAVTTASGGGPMAFTCALHTYFGVSSIDKVTVEGLNGVGYTDSLQGGKPLTQRGPVVFAEEVDRIYLGTPSEIKIVDAGAGSSVVIAKEGFPDAVVWNPWVAKSKVMGDFGDNEYQVMLCIEPAVAGSGAVTLEPGKSWRGKQVLTLSRA